MIVAAVALLGSAFSILPETDQSVLTTCGVDEAAFEAFLAMDQKSFDQDPNGGWRAVSSRDGCRTAAAILIESYILFSRPSSPEGHTILRWHAGQLLAVEGPATRERALAFLRGSYHEGPGEGGDDWDQYVDATIAFLEGDEERLRAARDRLAGMPPDERIQAFRRTLVARSSDGTYEEGFIQRPLNLDVVDGLLTCFGRTYQEAYSDKCRTK